MRFLAAILFLLLVLPAQAQQGQGLSKALVVSSCGSAVTATVGGLVYPTMDTTGRLCSHKTSSGGTGCAQATTYLGRTTGGNEGGNGQHN